MMTAPPLPNVTIDSSLRRTIDALTETFESVEEAELAALTTDIAGPLRTDQNWISFCELITLTIQHRGYAVVRGLDADEGRSLLIVSSAIRVSFDTYKPERIVKRFRMSPWTTELSHTLRAGDFHTDGNVSAVPPIATAMQCEHDDPGAPEYAEQRVAHLPLLLDRLASGTVEEREALSFLTGPATAMAHERSREVWRGTLVQNDTIRYHPHSLRVACERLKGESSKLESVIFAVHGAAMDVSVPFHTSPGDTVLVSNRTALHYRGECSVRFTKFPTEFEARSLLVLHMKDSTE